ARPPDDTVIETLTQQSVKMGVCLAVPGHWRMDYQEGRTPWKCGLHEGATEGNLVGQRQGAWQARLDRCCPPPPGPFVGGGGGKRRGGISVCQRGEMHRFLVPQIVPRLRSVTRPLKVADGPLGSVRLL